MPGRRQQLLGDLEHWWPRYLAHPRLYALPIWFDLVMLRVYYDLADEPMPPEVWDKAVIVERRMPLPWWVP